MAMAFIGRTLITKTNPNASLLPSVISRPFTARSLAVPSSSPLLRLRSLVTLTEFRRSPSIPSSLVGLRCFSTRQATSSLNDPSPNWNNRPPKETILLDGCDFEHWLIVMEKPEGEPTRDEIIDSYIKTAATVVGSEEEARKQMYSVSTRHYFAFGVIVSEEASYKFKELPRVRWVLPDSYLNVREKDYGGEPFINGEAVPYDPKYHEEWVRNNARANERSRRNDRPRNFDRSRNFERRRENMQSRDTQAPAGNPGQNMGGGMPAQNMQNSGPSMGGGRPAQNMQMPGPNMGGMPPNSNMPPASPNYGGMPPASPNYGGVSPNAPNYGGVPPNAPNYGGVPPNAPNYGGVPPSAPNYGGVPPSANMHNNVPNYGGMPPRDAGPNVGYSNNITRDARPNPGFSNIPNAGNPGNGNFQYREAPGPMPNRDGPGPMPNRDYQNNYAPNGNTGGMPSGNAYQVRDIPGRDRDY